MTNLSADIMLKFILSITTPLSKDASISTEVSQVAQHVVTDATTLETKLAKEPLSNKLPQEDYFAIKNLHTHQYPIKTTRALVNK